MKTSGIVLLTLLLWATCAFAQYQPRAIWQREGAGDSSLYGEAILALGDQNRDGYNDWAVYSAGLGYALPGTPNEPKVEFFHGGNPPETEPYMVRVADLTIETPIRGAWTIGDVNGDRFTDWAIFTSTIGDTGHPIAKLYWGGPGSHDAPDLVVPILWVDPIGDFNGDGYDDLRLSSGGILFGGNPMDIVPDWQPTLTSIALTGAGDLNGDHFSDLVYYANNDHGAKAIFLGGTQPDTAPAYYWNVLNEVAVTCLHDVNGDGFDELCYGQGGGWGGLSWGGATLHNTEDAHLTFACSGSGPAAILSAGDFNHDGIGDVVMLRDWCENCYWGVLTLHLGSRWLNETPTNPLFVIYGWTDPFNLIHFRTAVSLGDVDGDGVDDLGIGANGRYDIEHAAQRGKAVILAGDSTLRTDAHEPLIPHPSSLILSVYPNPFNSSATIRIQLPAYQENVDLAVHNIVGQRVLFTHLRANSGVISYRLDASNLSTGLYFLSVKSDKFQNTTKLMVLK